MDIAEWDALVQERRRGEKADDAWGPVVTAVTGDFPWTEDLRGAGETAFVLRDILWSVWRCHPHAAVTLGPAFRQRHRLNHNTLKRAVRIMEERELIYRAGWQEERLLKISLPREVIDCLMDVRYGPMPEPDPELKKALDERFERFLRDDPVGRAFGSIFGAGSASDALKDTANR